TQGRKIERALARTSANLPERVLLVGLANEYLSYFTTTAEYDLQHYEGASTMYGADSASFVTGALVRVATELTGSALVPESYVYLGGRWTRFSMPRTQWAPGAPESMVRMLLRDPLSDRIPEWIPTFCWTD